MSPWFEKEVAVRFKSDVLKRVKKIITDEPDEKYHNRSHFIRCAVNRLVVDEEKWAKERQMVEDLKRALTKRRKR